MVYVVTYDLNKAGQDYKSLSDAIKEQGDAIHSLQNLWFLKTNQYADQISSNLKSVIDSNDNLFISEVTSNHGGRLPITVVNWLNANL